MEQPSPSAHTDTKQDDINQPGPNREEVPKDKIDPVTETNIDPEDDGDGEGG